MQVNIYVESNIKGAKAKNGIGMYILEAEIDGQVYTKTEKITMSDVSRNALELLVLKKALQRMTKSSEIRIFTCNDTIYGTFQNGWNLVWADTGWTNKKGDKVKNWEQWKDITELLENHTFEITRESHSYRTWMQNNLKEE